MLSLVVRVVPQLLQFSIISVWFFLPNLDKENPNNKRVIDSFFNWYYASTRLATIIALTVIVFIQDKGWPIGYGVPACLMVLSIAAFLFGSPLYVHVKVKDSLFVGMFQVPIAAFRKRKI